MLTLLLNEIAYRLSAPMINNLLPVAVAGLPVAWCWWQRNTLAGLEWKHGPRFCFHVPRPGNDYVSETETFLFPCYKMIPQVLVPILRMGTRPWLLCGVLPPLHSTIDKFDNDLPA